MMKTITALCGMAILYLQIAISNILRARTADLPELWRRCFSGHASSVPDFRPMELVASVTYLCPIAVVAVLAFCLVRRISCSQPLLYALVLTTVLFLGLLFWVMLLVEFSFPLGLHPPRLH